MSDSRWSDVEADVEQALMHFGMAIQIFQAGGFDDPGIEGYKSTSAFKQGMDAGYTAVERAIEGILGILGEELPTGRDFHKVLLDRVTRPLTGDHARPAIFDERLKKDLLEALRMRHRVRYSSYDEFIPHLAEPSVDAARDIVARIRNAINEFKRKIDPERADDNDGDDGAGGGASGGPARGRGSSSSV
ncbi:MAG: hypothetical protein IJ935_12095 [Afipia sp.]|nr:hypothetical protein [Afipia sp.]